MQRPRDTACSNALLIYILLCLAYPVRTFAQPTPAATSAFNAYVLSVEARLNQQHKLPGTFLVSPGPSAQARLRSGEFILEDLTPTAGFELPGALLHHWRGTAFVPHAHAADVDHLLRDINAYPQHFAPQVLKAQLLQQTNDHLLMQMRVRQKHILTVVLDATYAVNFGQLDPEDRYSISRSTEIAEIDSPATPHEHALSPQQEHGFLWRSNTYWSYQERNGGLYIQIESISLSRSIPTGLAWAVRPFIASVPRESLEFTLRSAANALR